MVTERTSTRELLVTRSETWKSYQEVVGMRNQVVVRQDRTAEGLQSWDVQRHPRDPVERMATPRTTSTTSKPNQKVFGFALKAALDSVESRAGIDVFRREVIAFDWEKESGVDKIPEGKSRESDGDSRDSLRQHLNTFCWRGPISRWTEERVELAVRDECDEDEQTMSTSTRWR